MRSFRLFQGNGLSSLTRTSLRTHLPQTPSIIRTTQPSAPSSLTLTRTAQRNLAQPLRSRQPFSTSNFRRAARTDAYNPTPNLKSPEPSLSLSQRMRKLSREYGWSAVGVYFFLSALDFPFCFIAVRWLGTDRIGRWEHNIVEFVKRAIPFQVPDVYKERWRELVGMLRGTAQKAGVGEQVETVGGELVAYDHGVEAADKENTGENASIWTQLALAYAIHKSFIFIRVPLTAAVTPRVVKTLRGWGWNIGKITPKAERVAAKAEKAAKKATNSSK